MVLGDDFKGTVIYTDAPNWEAWTFTEPGQVWSQEEQGIKWAGFRPNRNRGVSPEIEEAAK